MLTVLALLAVMSVATGVINTPSSDWFQGAIVTGLVVFVLMAFHARGLITDGKIETCRAMVAQLDLERKLNREIYCANY